tara:strand:- start:228 stop:572 length:345 start_codon:yes stop_codon:yes gene_type:complete
MSKKRKLKVGDRVMCKFLGEECNAVVIEVTSPGKYKLQYHKYGPRPTILPNAQWYNPKDKKAAAGPWHIHEYLGSNEGLKTKGNTDKAKPTTIKNELKDAIKKQKDFIRGNIKK